MSESKIGTFSALSIGIGGMVGGGIFAVTGLTIQLTRGSAPLAFLVAGVVALLTAYSYWRLSLRYPSQGGTVEFLNCAFGSGMLTGTLNILLCLSYVVLLGIYAYAFGAYGASLFPPESYDFWKHVLITFSIVALALINYFGADLTIRFENWFNVTKMILLAVFIIAGFAVPMDWTRLGTTQWVEPFQLVSGAMIIFLNYEGFELIANASATIKKPRVALPVAYIGGVLIVILLYLCISAVVVGHLDFSTIQQNSDYALSTAAKSFMGQWGGVMIVIAALLATSSAINATFYGSGKLTYIIAKSGELPKELERSIHHQPLEGMIIFAVLTLFVANFIPLQGIATMGSAGFLLIFLAVNLANLRLAKETESHKWISALAALACAIALAALCWQTLANVTSRWQIWVLVGMVGVSWLTELVYRRITGRKILLRYFKKH